MKKIRISVLAVVIAFLTLSFSSLQAQEFEELNRDSITCLVKRYYDLNKKIFARNSTVDDIDNVFNLFTDDFTYVHPKYGGTYTRETLYSGYVRNQENGGYDGKVVDVKIINMIVGLNAIAVEKKFVEKTKNGLLEEGQPEMTLFEFRSNKIARIFEYW
ncbi:hypothetical protein [Neolewinella persica]|uniref:hypothetical protein n=1 Tax=Neolewinella persica TaxID=70998 RepID=UPI000365F98D|nr:hypothetical protein [Neolewinella persica]